MDSSPATTLSESTMLPLPDEQIEPPVEPHGRSAVSEVAAVVVWVAVVIGLLAYLCFGSITARMWKLDQLQNAWVEDHSPRRIAHIWNYQFDHLPQFAGSMMMQVLFGGAVVVILVGTAVCLWLMLSEVRRPGSKPE